MQIDCKEKGRRAGPNATRRNAQDSGESRDELRSQRSADKHPLWVMGWLRIVSILVCRTSLWPLGNRCNLDRVLSRGSPRQPGIVIRGTSDGSQKQAAIMVDDSMEDLPDQRRSLNVSPSGPITVVLRVDSDALE